MIRPRPISQLSRRVRGLRPVPATGRTTARFTRPHRARPGAILPAERDERRARGRRQHAARRAGRGKLERGTGWR